MDVRNTNLPGANLNIDTLSSACVAMASNSRFEFEVEHKDVRNNPSRWREIDRLGVRWRVGPKFGCAVEGAPLAQGCLGQEPIEGSTHID